MPNYTENYNLKKPLPNENYNVQDQNDNMDTIDTELKKVNDKVDSIEVPVTSVNGKVGDVELTAADVDAETPAGAQAKAEAAAAAAVAAHEEDPDPHNQYALDIDLAALQEEVDTHKAENTKLWSDYDYPLATIVGTQIRVTHESNSRVVKFELAEGVTGGEITVSLDDGATEKPLVDITNEPITELDKGFVEVIESEDFFTLVPRGDKLESPFDTKNMELQPAIMATSSSKEWQEAFKIENPYGGIVHALACRVSGNSNNVYFRVTIDGVTGPEFYTNLSNINYTELRKILFDGGTINNNNMPYAIPFKNSFKLEFRSNGSSSYAQAAISYSLATKKVKQYTFQQLVVPTNVNGKTLVDIMGSGKIYLIIPSSTSTRLDVYVDGVYIANKTLSSPSGSPEDMPVRELFNTSSGYSAPTPTYTFKERLLIINKYPVENGNVKVIVALED